MDKIDNKKEKGASAFKAGIWYTISTVLVKFITVISMPIYTRMLSTYDYGIASTFSSWYSLMIILCSLDLEMSIGRAKQDYRMNLRKYISSLQLLSGIFSLVFFGICFIALSKISMFTEMSYGLLGILAIYLFFAPAVSLSQARYRYEYRYKENIAIMIFVAVGSIITSLVLINIIPIKKYYGKVIGSALPTVFLGITYWIKAIKSSDLAINIDYWKYALKISAPMIVHSMALNILATSDRVVITKYIGAEATGIYTVAYQYALLVNVIMGAVNQAWQPWFHDNYYAGNFELIKLKTKKLTSLGYFIGIGCIAFAPEMISFLGPEEYGIGVWAVPPIVLGVICQFLYTNYINIELHLKTTQYASLGTVFAAVINIILNMFLVEEYGFIIAAYTTLFSYIILLIVHYCITRFLLKVNLYDNMFFVITFLCVIGVCIIFMLLYSSLVVRFILMCLIGIGFLIYNNDVISLVIRRLVALGVRHF